MRVPGSRRTSRIPYTCSFIVAAIIDVRKIRAITFLGDFFTRRDCLLRRVRKIGPRTVLLDTVIFFFCRTCRTMRFITVRWAFIARGELLAIRRYITILLKNLSEKI